MSNPIENLAGGRRNYFLFVFATITGVLLLGSWAILGFITSVVQVDDAVPENGALSPIYINYQVDVDEYISAESYLAMGNYQQEFEQPQNVQVLVNYSTQEINGYMMNHVVAGLQVNCTYCHSLENFAADEWGDDPESNTAEANKMSARRHLELVQDLNQNWLTQLDALSDQKQPSGAQITCATCHYGEAQFQIWPADQEVLPDDFRLPLDETFNHSVDTESILNVNARRDISLDTVQYQQQVMYHMNSSLNVGCTHCHNSRYFPSKEVPAVHYAQNMLQMTQYIWLNYSESLNEQEPSCNVCHRANVIPAGSAKSVDVMPPALVAVDEG